MLSRRELDVLHALAVHAKQTATTPVQAGRALYAKDLIERELKTLDAIDYGFITKREETPDESS